MKRILPILIILFFSCNDIIEVDPETGFEIFTISSGEHSSINRREAFIGSGIEVTVLFDSSAEYSTLQQTNQADINKLIGFSDCSGHHHRESARFGWRWYDEQLEILAYVYNQGELTFELMGAIALNQEVNLSIHVESEMYVFMGEGLDSVTLPRNNNCETGENYWLWPYFGGDETAPHDIKVQLKRRELE